jgi:WD40 repeat protein/DNA-binding SARP family transcriptional activator
LAGPGSASSVSSAISFTIAAVNARIAADLGIPFESREGYGRPVEFRLLGSVEVVEQGNGAIALGGPRQRAVLAHLLLRANNLVPTEVLIDEVWGDEPPEAARNALQSYASHLRKAIGPGRLEGSRAGYVLRAEPSEVDTVRFQSLLRDAQRLMPIDSKAAVAAFDAALSLWRGPAFGDLAPEPSLRAEAARLDELRLGAMEDRIESLLTIGVHDQVIGELEGLTARHPLRERLWGQLILALYRAGRQAEALGAYQRAREILADELGIDPSPDLRKLHARVLQQSPDLDVGGTPLRGYRLLERVGTGSFGTVWRAIQPEVGRDVAVKAIHPHLANDPDFIRRFEAEAQLIARLEHPHVVPLYDYWREPGGAYLVMRFLRGGSLAEALETAALEIKRVVRLMEQVSGALAAAHRQGIVHRDVKPSNILLDDEGNAYLADFGIAKDLSAPEMTEPGAIKGSLLYLAPEQIRGGTITPRTDVYALGIVLYEVLVREHPFRDVPDMAVYERQLREPLPSARSRRTDLPPAVDDVIATATAKDADLRFPDATALAAAVRNALSPGRVSVAVSAPFETRNPYKGLRPFDEADAHDFYGREAFVERLLQRWRRPGPRARFLAVVGPSGSGKSSVVRAGLVPALRRGRIEGSEEWFISELVPGRHPMEELEAALLRVAARPPAGLLQVLESGPRGLLQAVDRVVPEGSELVLFVDQFEEAFTLTDDEAERSLLLESLRVAAADPASRTRIVATLRADFYDRPLNYPRFGPILGASTEVMTPLAPDELEQAIVRPAGSVGLRVEPALVAQVASDVAEQPGALPLVQYALTELFERRDGGTLTLAAYRDIGGVGGALAARGEQLYGARDSVGRESVRQLFLRLVSLGEGVADTRRRVPLSELSSLEVMPEAMESTLDAFGRHRLLTFDRDPATREPTVEVAHEALLRSWPRLHEWIDAAREDVRTLRRFTDAATEWERSEREASFLLRGSRLDQFESWVDGTDLAVGREELGYLRASASKRDEERAAEVARRDHERALERRSVKRLRALVAVFAVAALVAASLTAIATRQNTRAERESRIATARELAAAAVANLEVDTQRSLLLALEAVRTTREADGTVLPEAEEALHWAIQADRLLLTIPGNGEVDVSPDGSRVLVEQELGTASVYDAASGERLLTVESGGQLGDLDYSPDGRFFATSNFGGDGFTRIWDAASGDEIRRLGLEGGPALCCDIEFSPDRRFLATQAFTTTYLWDLETGRQVINFHAFGQVAFAPNGKRILIGQDVYDAYEPDGGHDVVSLSGHMGEVNDASWSPDGRTIAISGSDRVIVWDARSGDQMFTIFAPPGGDFTDLDFDPLSTRIATGMGDGAAIVWELSPSGAKEAYTLAGHGAAIRDVVFGPDGMRLFTGGADGTAKIWDVTPDSEREWLTVSGATGVAYSPDGDHLATGSEDGNVNIYDARTGRRVLVLRGHTGWVNAVDFSPDGSRLASAADDGTVRIWDTASGVEVITLDESGNNTDVAFSPDGTMVATTNYAFTGRTRIWDAATGALIRSLRNSHGAQAEGRFSVEFSPDGALLAGSDVEATYIWRVDDGRIVARLQQPEYVLRLTFSPDGRQLVTAAYDGSIRMWDVRTGREIRSVLGNTVAQGLAFSPDGRQIATLSRAGLQLWNARTLEEPLVLDPQVAPESGPVDKLAFSPDGTRLAAASGEGFVRIYVLPIDELMPIARARLLRDFTEQECRQYLHLETCAQA